MLTLSKPRCPVDKVLAIAIPTCSRQMEDIRIGYVLEALALQPTSSFYDSFEIYIWDEGPIPMTANMWVQLALDLLVQRGHLPTYLRRSPSRGVANARRELLAAVPEKHQHILMLDDDLLVMPGAISELLRVAAIVGNFGFIQGAKIELDKRRQYLNDINQLTVFEAEAKPQRLWFGDSAFLLVNRPALRHVRWDLVTRFAEDGLTGEDVAISLMIANHEPCFGIASAAGYHMSLCNPRWSWEIHSDVLQFELLRDVVSPETLERALPHLARHLSRTGGAEPQKEMIDDSVPSGT
jgi:Glycosyltransferase like family 2